MYQKRSHAHIIVFTVGTILTYLQHTVMLFFIFYFFWKGSLCSPNWLETHSVDQADLDLRDLPDSGS